MIQVTDNIWVGNSHDECYGDLSEDGIGAVLNVAYDLGTSREEWDEDVECMHVGLVDGPGNAPAAYCAAVLALSVLIDRHERVMVFCHEGSRSVAVIAMYLILKAGRVGDHPGAMNRWKTWDAAVADLRVRTSDELPEPHPAHREAADRMAYGLLEQML